MRPVLIYIIEFFLCSGLFLLLYRSLIVRKVSYGFCRRYLIIAMLLSATIPMLNVPLYPPQTIYLNIPVMTNNDQEPTDQEASASTAKAAGTTSVGTATNSAPQAQEIKPSLTPEQKWKLFFGILYGIGLVLSLMLIVSGILTVWRLKRKSEITVTPDFDLAESDRIKTPFSFMHTVFIGRDYDEKSRKHILSHESSHVHHRHSLEKLGMSTLRSLFWFNPFVWIAEKRLEEVQEWQADSDALADGYNLAEYRLSIVKQLFGCNPEMTSGLNSSFTKLRFLQMKQPEIKSAGLIQMVSSTFLAAVLFLSFGCTSSGVKPTREGTNTPSDRVFFIVDKYFEEAFGVKTRDYNLHETIDLFGKTETGIETHENYDNPLSPVTIAVNGILLAKTPTDACLKWVKESTPIYIGGKKSTLEEFRALKEGDYAKIYFYRPMGRINRETLSFVYVAVDKHEVPEYGYTVTIDNPKLDVKDIIHPAGMGFYEKLFIYQDRAYNVAVPDAKFMMDGQVVDYQVFREFFFDDNRKNYTVTVYRNREAKRLLGDDVWEVVEINTTRQDVRLYYNADDNRCYPAYGARSSNQAVSYDFIREKIQSAKEANSLTGELTLISLEVEGRVPDSLYLDLINKCIDTSDPAIKFTLIRNKEVRAKDKHGNTYVRDMPE